MNFVDDDESIMIQKDEKQKKNYRYLKVDLEEGKDGRRVKMMSTPASLTTNAGRVVTSVTQLTAQRAHVFAMMGFASHHEVCELALLREKDSSVIPISDKCNEESIDCCLN